MRDVKVVNYSTGKEYLLNAEERKDFGRELSRTAVWRSLHAIKDYILGKDKYVPPHIAPDARVLITENSGAVREYQIYGRAVLHNPATERNRQFYMGIILVEWVS